MTDPSRESDAVPSSPEELLARQRSRPPWPQKTERPRSEKVERLLALLQELGLCAWEKQQIALTLLRHLENFHDHVVADLQEDAAAPHRQIARWAVDADRLYRARMVLESIELE